MKLPVIRRLLKEDLQAGGEEIPAWVDSLLSPLNQFIDFVVLGLRNNVTFKDNFLGSQLTAKFTNKKELKVNPGTNQKVSGVIVLNVSGYVLKGFGWRPKSDGTLGVYLDVTDMAGTAPALAFNATIQILVG
jgi:hypothetical protein